MWEAQWASQTWHHQRVTVTPGHHPPGISLSADAKIVEKYSDMQEHYVNIESVQITFVAKRVTQSP